LRYGLPLAVTAASLATAGADGAPGRGTKAMAREVLLVAVAKPARPASGGGCIFEAAVLRSERGKPREPGSGIDVPVACPEAATGLEVGRFGRLSLGKGGRVLGFEALPAIAAAPEASVEAADRAHLWRLLRVDKRQAVLVDTDAVERDGSLRTGWLKRSLRTPADRNISQTIVRASFHCTDRTWSLHIWYARTNVTTVFSQGIVPEAERRHIPVPEGSPAELTLRVLCADAARPGAAS
jgi:hypothetical protein